MTEAGAREVFVPGAYEVGAFAHCTAAQGPGCASPTAGIPAVGVTFYEPKFANADAAVEQHAATSVYDSFGAVPLMILAASTATGCGNERDTLYSTALSVSEDNAYILVDDNCGNVDIRHFTGASAGQTIAGYTAGDISTSPSRDARWLRGSHKSKVLYRSGSNLRVYDAATDRWCTDSSTCTSTSAVNYWNPLAATFTFDENDVSPGNLIPLNRTSPNRVDVADVANKTTVSLASVPSGFFDFCQVTKDSTMVGCTIGPTGGNWYTWDAATGAILNGGAAAGDTGHAGFGILSNGTNVRVTFNDGTPPGTNSCSNGSFGPQRKSTIPWTGATATDFLQHPSPRDPQTNCADSHWAAHAAYPSPAHRLVAFDLSSGGDGDPRIVTAGALSANWDNDWRYLAQEVVVCDYDNPAGDIVNAPNCWRIAHHRAYDDNKDCNGCVNITADGKYVTFRSHLGTDSSGSGKRIYVVRAGPLR
jgi:hypothetical protein